MSKRLSMVVDGRDHIQGRPDARVTLVEYGDYECVHCGRAYLVVKALQRHLGAALRFVYRNFPLRELHPHAEAAARAAEAAAVQSKFWAMHDLLFENQRALGASDLRRYAGALSLDVSRWERDFSSETLAARVEQDLQSGLESGVGGTPSFFIDGSRHEGGADERSLLDALERAVRAPHLRAAT